MGAGSLPLAVDEGAGRRGGAKGVTCGTEAWVWTTVSVAVDRPSKTYKASDFASLRQNDEYPVIKALYEQVRVVAQDRASDLVCSDRRGRCLSRRAL